MDDLPNPLTPADCDLRGYRWMPLDVERVIDSDTFGLSTGDEFKTAFRLWAKSWAQVPAASLPDDDRLLAHLAGLSENMLKWKKVKAVALRGWILCSDGRLYHPVIAQKALESMGKREQHNEREENEQSRQQRYRERRKALFEALREHGIVPSKDTKTDELERLVSLHQASPSVTQNVTCDVTANVTHDAAATAIDSTRPDSTGQDITKTLGGSTPVVEPCVRAKPAELSAAMRRHSIEAQPGDPRVIAAAESGISIETVEAACGEARAAKQGQRINAGYVLTIAERWTREAAAPRPAPSARASPQRTPSYHDERAATIAALTGANRNHEPPERDIIDVNAKLIG